MRCCVVCPHHVVPTTVRRGGALLEGAAAAVAKGMYVRDCGKVSSRQEAKRNVNEIFLIRKFIH